MLKRLTCSESSPGWSFFYIGQPSQGFGRLRLMLLPAFAPAIGVIGLWRLGESFLNLGHVLVVERTSRKTPVGEIVQLAWYVAREAALA